MFEQDDYVLRQVHQLVELVASMVGLAPLQDEARAEAEIDDAYRRLLNMDRQLFEALDGAGVAAMLRDPERILLVAQVLQAEGDLARQKGEDARARRCYQKALDMLPGKGEDAGHAELAESLGARLQAS